MEKAAWYPQTGIRGVSGDQTVWDRPVFIIPRSWETFLPITENRREVG